MKFKFFSVLIVFLMGFGLGAYLFSDTQKRTFLQTENCQTACFKTSELLGLLASVGIQKSPSFFPDVILETEKTVVMRHPYSESPIHYLVFPKKDIKNVSEIEAEDQPFIMDVLAVIRKIVTEKNLSDYQVITNGPGQQQVTYLHFHLMAQEKEAIEIP